MRIAWDEECFGWLLSDSKFEPQPMPLEWRGEYQGRQIESSRFDQYSYVTTPSDYRKGAHYPTHEEKMAPIRKMGWTHNFIDGEPVDLTPEPVKSNGIFNLLLLCATLALIAIIIVGVHDAVWNMG